MSDIISTHFERLDRYLKGADKSSLICICAKPGMGLQTFSESFKREFNFLDVRTVQMPEYKGKPTLNDLQKIDAVFSDADVIMFLHRDNFTFKNMDNRNPDITELIIAKNRYGDIGVINLKYNSEEKNFTETDD